MKKSQIATEFMLMVGLAMVVVFVFLAVSYSLIIDYSEEKNMNKLMDFGYSIQNELILASEVEPGYQRIITLPEKIGSTSYSITIVNNDLVIPYRGGEYLFQIPELKAGSITTLTPGNTYTITKEEPGADDSGVSIA
ncbi:hypothetical protein JXB28_00105 [Candidatus Woesearchaeota archaeon]|nr:hypothetical protein [Candidatus Woesearchaeota archaeon]